MHARFLAIILVLMLLTVPAQAAEQSFSGLFSLSYDENTCFPDAVSYLEGSDGGSRWLMMLVAEDYLIDVTMCRVEGWEHLSLTDAAAPMTSWYLEEMTADGTEHIGNVSAGGVLFCLFRMSDEDGEYLLGETVVNGWTVSFYAYYDAPEQQTDERLVSALTDLLTTFTPDR